MNNTSDITASFTFARKDDQGRKIPQAIAHRGYKAAHPENTMGAFKGAVEVGAHAIETDLHISKDSVVVLSHVRRLHTGKLKPIRRSLLIIE
jgi:tubulin gamma